MKKLGKSVLALLFCASFSLTLLSCKKDKEKETEEPSVQEPSDPSTPSTPTTPAVNKTINITSSNTVIEVGEAKNFDLKTLFTIKEDGNNVAVTDTMINDGGFEAECGSYDVVLTYNTFTATSTVKVVENSEVTILVNEDKASLTKGDNDYDLTQVFSLYIGSEKQTVTNDMLSLDTVNRDKVGKYNLELTYDRFGEIYRETAVFQVIPQVTIELIQGNLLEYRNAQAATFGDWNEFFAVTLDGQPLNVVDSMIEKDLIFDKGGSDYIFGTLKGGDYVLKCVFNVQGVHFESEEIHIKEYVCDVVLPTTDIVKTYYDPQLNVPDTNPILNIFSDIRINNQSITSTSEANVVVFVEEGDTTTVIPEGKVKATYTYEGVTLQEGKVPVGGEYEITLNFELEGFNYSETAKVTVLPQTSIFAFDQAVFAGVTKAELAKLFQVYWWDPSASYSNGKKQDVTEDMIATDVDPSSFVAGQTYNVTCNFTSTDKGSGSKTIQVTVYDAKYSGEFARTNSASTYLIVDKNGQVYPNGSKGSTSARNYYLVPTATAGVFDLYNYSSSDSIITSKLYATVEYKEVADKLVVGYISTTNSSSFSSIGYMYTTGVGAEADWTAVAEATGYLNDEEIETSDATEEEIGKAYYKVIQLSYTVEGSTTKQAYLIYEHKVIDVVDGKPVYSKTWYYDVSLTGEGFASDKTLTTTDKLGSQKLEFDFTGASSFKAYDPDNKPTPVEPEEIPSVTYTGTIAGTSANITLFENGTATWTRTDVTIYQYDNVIHWLKNENVICIWWKEDFSTTQHLFITLEGSNYTEVTTEDTAQTALGKYGTNDYNYIKFIGHNFIITYGVGVSGLSCATINMDGNTWTITTTLATGEVVSGEYELTNGDNVLLLVSKDENFYVSTDHKDLDYDYGETIKNNKLTVLKDFFTIPVNGTFDIAEAFKFERDNEGTIEEVTLNTTMYNISALDMTKDGYYQVFFDYKVGNYTYTAAVVVYVAPAKFAGLVQVGAYKYYDSSSYTITFNPDGTLDQGSSNKGFWGFNADDSIFFNYNQYGSILRFTGWYEDGILKVEDKNLTTPKYRYYFQGNDVELFVKSANFGGEDRILTRATINGLEDYYYQEGATFYGKVNVQFDSMILDSSATQLIVSGADEEIYLDIKLSSGNFAFPTYTPKNSNTFNKGTIKLDGCGQADVDGELTTYSFSKAGNLQINIGGEDFILKVDSENKYEKLVADALAGLKFVLADNTYYFTFDGLGAGAFCRYYESDTTYTYTEDTKTVVVKTYKYNGDVDDTFTFTLSADGNTLTCSSTTYSSYVAEGSQWIKQTA